MSSIRVDAMICSNVSFGRARSRGMAGMVRPLGRKRDSCASQRSKLCRNYGRDWYKTKVAKGVTRR